MKRTHPNGGYAASILPSPQLLPWQYDDQDTPAPQPDLPLHHMPKQRHGQTGAQTTNQTFNGGYLTAAGNGSNGYRASGGRSEGSNGSSHDSGQAYRARSDGQQGHASNGTATQGAGGSAAPWQSQGQLKQQRQSGAQQPQQQQRQPQQLQATQRQQQQQQPTTQQRQPQQQRQQPQPQQQPVTQQQQTTQQRQQQQQQQPSTQQQRQQQPSTQQQRQQQPATQQQRQQQPSPRSQDGDDLYPSLDWATAHPSSHGALYTQLTADIVKFVASNEPSSVDMALRRVMVQLMGDAVKAALPEHKQTLQVLPFGSFVSGLGTSDSDLDLCVVNVCEPGGSTGFYDRNERPKVASLLDRIARAVRQQGSAIEVRHLMIIRSSRIPLAKIEARVRPNNLLRAHLALLPPNMRPEDLSRVSAFPVDISIASHSGPEAAENMAREAHRFPCLRPLVLVIKSFLKARDMNDVATGGLSSYGLILMVIAHLTEEERAGNVAPDLGWLLHRFFMRYGQAFDCKKDVVCTRSGGVVSRSRVGSYSNLDRICCMDPLTSRNVTEGCFRTREVLAAITRAAQYLDKQANTYTQKRPPAGRILKGLMRKPSYYDDNSDEYAEEEYYTAPEDRRAAGPALGRQRAAGPPPTKFYAYTYPGEEQQADLPYHVPAGGQGTGEGMGPGAGLYGDLPAPQDAFDFQHVPQQSLLGMPLQPSRHVGQKRTMSDAGLGW